MTELVAPCCGDDGADPCCCQSIELWARDSDPGSQLVIDWCWVPFPLMLSSCLSPHRVRWYISVGLDNSVKL